jgi:ubiquinone/menaquinone biosynthesis C-methylase UbiE
VAEVSAGAALWGGVQGVRWAEHQDAYDASFGEVTAQMFAHAKIGPGDRVLDIGCGCGQVGRMAAGRAKSGRVLGVDVSAPMLERAKLLAAREGLDNVDYILADAETHRFEAGAFDVAISRCGVMWFGDTEAAFANIGVALRPGGRLVFSSWQGADRNPASGARDSAYLAAGLPLNDAAPGTGPFSLAEPDRIVALLETAGYENVVAHDVTTDRLLGATIEEAYELHLGGSSMREHYAGLTEEAIRQGFDAAKADVARWIAHDGVRVPAAAWVVSATRH